MLFNLQIKESRKTYLTLELLTFWVKYKGWRDNLTGNTIENVVQVLSNLPQHHAENDYSVWLSGGIYNTVLPLRNAKC